MEVKLLDIQLIKPYFKNPRNNKNSIKEVAESIKEFGFKVPITVDKDYVIITGHTRFEASKYLGLKKIPCIIVNDLDEEKVKAYRLVDNKVQEFARWDYEKLEEELRNIKNIEMELYGFIKEENEINWDDVKDLDDLTYEEPEHKKIECPYCHHIDRHDRFKKVSVDEI